MSATEHPLGFTLFERDRAEPRTTPPARAIGELYDGELVIIQQADTSVAVFDPSENTVTRLNSSRMSLEAYLDAFAEYLGPAEVLTEEQQAERVLALTEGIKIPRAARPAVSHRKRVSTLKKALKRADRSGLARGGWWENVVDEASDDLL